MSPRLSFLLALAACSADHHSNPDASPDGVVDGPIDSPPGALTIVHQFDGDRGPGLAACQMIGGHCDRPELNMAADGAHVVQVTSQRVNIYDYNGGAIDSKTMAQFITNAGLMPTTSNGKPPYEPHVVFDEHAGRWIVTVSCLFDCLLVSATADPGGAWKGVYIANNGTDPGIHLGYDKNGVYLSEFDAGHHDPNTANFSYALFAIPTSEIAWTGAFAPAHLNRSTTNTPLDAQPVIDHDTQKSPTAPAFFMAKTCPAGGCQNTTNFTFDWLITTVTWSGTTATYSADQLVKTDIGSTQSLWKYNTPLASPQAGSAVTLRVIEDHRVIDAVQHGTHVHGVLGSGPCTIASSCGAQGVDTDDLFIWVDLDCTNAAACTVAATAKGAIPGQHLFYPSVGVDAAGNAGVVVASSSSTSDVSLLAFRHLAGDAPITLSAPTAVIAGSQPDTCMGTTVSFGNAVGIATVRDPLDGTKLWTTNQYGGSASPCVWSTRIVEYQLQ